jgi:hypothetical protein
MRGHSESMLAVSLLPGRLGTDFLLKESLLQAGLTFFWNMTKTVLIFWDRCVTAWPSHSSSVRSEKELAIFEVFANF